MDLAAFAQYWKDARKDKTDVLLLVTSPHCPYCVMFRPEWDRFAARSGARGFDAVDVDSHAFSQALSRRVLRLPAAVPFQGVPFVLAVPGGRAAAAVDFDEFLRATRRSKRSAAALAAFAREVFPSRRR
jgi:thiol-disulfide isomerase/thioredoxin